MKLKVLHKMTSLNFSLVQSIIPSRIKGCAIIICIYSLFTNAFAQTSHSSTLDSNFELVLTGSYIPFLIDPKTKRLFGSAVENDIQNIRDFDLMGLSELRYNRDYRMSLLTNLNGAQGVQNLISNTYGKGCLLFFEEKQNAGHNEYLQIYPNIFDKDGNKIECLKSHGETMVSADFNNDGLMDLLLPYYEKTYLLKNLGNYEFVDVAPTYLSLDDYIPRVEGAAIVDLFQTGCLDILVGPTVAKGDCKGGFINLDVPDSYRIADEGLIVSDLDNDGYYEIIKIVPYEASLHLFKAKNNLIKLYKTIRLDQGGIAYNTFGVDAHDLFAKGCDDLVVAGGLPNGSQPSVLINDCNGGFEIKKFASSKGSFQTTVMAEDINGDGRVDIVAPALPVLNIAPYFVNARFDSNLQVPSNRVNFVYFNESAKPLNFKFSIFRNGSIYNAVGASVSIQGKSGNKKVIHTTIGSGYLTQKSISPLVFLRKNDCPFELRVAGSSDSFVLNCDSSLTTVSNSSGYHIEVFGSFDETMSILNLAPPLTNQQWNAIDGGIVQKSEAGYRLINSRNSWGRIRASIVGNSKCGGNYEFLVNGSEQGTNLMAQLKDETGEFILKPKTVLKNLSYKFHSKAKEFVLDLFNEDPIQGVASYIRQVQLSCSN